MIYNGLGRQAGRALAFIADVIYHTGDNIEECLFNEAIIQHAAEHALTCLNDTMERLEDKVSLEYEPFKSEKMRHMKQ